MDDWQSGAACAAPGIDPGLFFDPDRDAHRPAALAARQAAAKAVCATCPVAAECLAASVRNQDADGVFGGMTAKERMAIPRPCPLRGCSKTYTPTRLAQRYCSGKCASKAANRRYEAQLKAQHAIDDPFGEAATAAMSAGGSKGAFTTHSRYAA